MMNVFPLTPQLRQDRYNATFRLGVVTTTGAPYARVASADPNRVALVVMPGSVAEFRLLTNQFVFSIPWFVLFPSLRTFILDREQWGLLISGDIFVFSTVVGSTLFVAEIIVPELKL